MESGDEDEVQCRKRRRRSIRNLRRQSDIQPFTLTSLHEEEPVNKDKQGDEDGSHTDATVYGSMWCESQEPVKKKRRRSNMFIHNVAKESDISETRIDTEQMCEGRAGAIGCKTDVDENVAKNAIENSVEKNADEVNKSVELTILKDLPSYQTLTNSSTVNRAVLNDSIEADELNSGFIGDLKPTFTPTPNKELADDSYNESLTPYSDSGRMSFKDSPISMSPDFPTSNLSTPTDIDSTADSVLELSETIDPKTDNSYLTPTDTNSTAESVFKLGDIVEPKIDIDPKNNSDLSLSNKENSYTVVKEGDKSKNSSPGFMSMCKAIAGKVAEFVKTSPSYLTGSFSTKDIADITNTSGSPVLKLIDEKSIIESAPKEKTIAMYDKSYIRDFRNVPETQCLVYNTLEKDDVANVESKTSASDSKPEEQSKTDTKCKTSSRKTDTKCKTPSAVANGSRLQKNQGSAISGSAKKMTDRKVFHDTFNAVSEELLKCKKRLGSESEGLPKTDNREKAVDQMEDKNLKLDDGANKVNEKTVDSLSAMETNLKEKTDSVNAEKIDKDDEAEKYDIVDKEIQNTVSINSEEVEQTDKDTGDDVNYQISDHSETGLEMITGNQIDENRMEVESGLKGSDDIFENKEAPKTIDLKQELSTTSEAKIIKPIDSKGDKSNDIVSCIVDTFLDKVPASSEMSGKSFELASKKSKEVKRQRKRRALDIAQHDEFDDDNVKTDKDAVLDINPVLSKLPKHAENIPLTISENFVEETAEPLKPKIDSVVEAIAVTKTNGRGRKRKSGQFKQIKDSKKNDNCVNKDNLMLDVKVYEDNKVDKLVEIGEETIEEIINVDIVKTSVKTATDHLEAKRRRNRMSFGVPNIIPEEKNDNVDNDVDDKQETAPNGEQEIEKTDKQIEQTPETVILEEKIAEMNMETSKKEKATRQTKTISKKAKRCRSANIEDLKLKRYQPVIESPTEGNRSTDSRPDVTASPNLSEMKEVEKESVASDINRDNRTIDCDTNAGGSNVPNNSSGLNITNLAQLVEDISHVNIVATGKDSAEMAEIDNYKARRKRRRSANEAELKVQLLVESMNFSPDPEAEQQPSTVKKPRKQKHSELSMEELEKLYRNKNFVRPEEKKSWVTIYESATTSEDSYGKKRLQRHIDFERPTQMKLRRRLQRAVKNGWDPKKKKKLALKDEIFREKLDKIWTDINETVDGENSLQGQIHNIVETQ